MDTIVLTKRASGGFTALLNGLYVKYFPVANYETNNDGIRLITPGGYPINDSFLPPSAWTIGGVTSFTTILNVCNALDAL